MTLLEKIESKIITQNKIYIIPTREGFTYLLVNFTLFLIGLTYANNFTLLISFILFIFFILIMFQTHGILEEFKERKINIQSATPKNFYLQLNEIPAYINIEYHINGPHKNQKLSFKRINEHETKSKFKLQNAIRGFYEQGRFKFFSSGEYGLFYVWSYLKQDSNFYIYPKLIESSSIQNFKKNLITHFGSNEFAFHSPYMHGMNSKRIDWKVYAKSDQLYAKRYDQEEDYGQFIDYYLQTGSHEEKISKTAYLVHKAKQKGLSYAVQLRSKKIGLSNGEAQYHEVMQALSVEEHEN